MKDYRPLILQTLGVRLPGLCLRRLRLHRHLPEADALEEHSHRFAQILCYLSGQGSLRAEGKEFAVFPGALALLPPGCMHGFREAVGRRPLSLALDFDMDGADRFRFSHLTGSEAARARSHLSEISRQRDPGSPQTRLLAASTALAILDIQLRALGLLPREGRAVPSFVKKFTSLAGDPDRSANSISELAGAVGYQPDYLNRRFKQVTGLTLRQQRDALRLEKAKRWLTEGLPAQEAGRRAGIDDPNYFSRWFKRHTGLSPSRYAGAGGGPGAKAPV